jgi:hypothetical protein
MNKINLFTAAAEMAVKLDSLYTNNRFGKKDILEFMDANEWFGGMPVIENKIPYVTDTDFNNLFKKPLTLWLSAYKKPGHEKINLMLNHFYEQYPETCGLYRKYVTDNELWNNAWAWKLLDFVLSEINKDTCLPT